MFSRLADEGAASRLTAGRHAADELGHVDGSTRPTAG
jgi:hypothetical protein